MLTARNRCTRGTARGRDWYGCQYRQERRQSLRIRQQVISSIYFLGYRRRVLGLPCLHPQETLRGREIRHHMGPRSDTLSRAFARRP